tara:strand:- start:710 stop:925 length:216 start_codon:yes stop_codon:yes gene_type:complete
MYITIWTVFKKVDREIDFDLIVFANTRSGGGVRQSQGHIKRHPSMIFKYICRGRAERDTINTDMKKRSKRK